MSKAGIHALLCLVGLGVLMGCAPASMGGDGAEGIAGQFFLFAPPVRSEVDLAQAERQAEALIVQGVNAERLRMAPEVPPLLTDPGLEEIARKRSEDMAEGAAPFSHYDGNGHFTAEDMMRKRFGAEGLYGENILEQPGLDNFDPAGFAKRAVEGWMMSPGHRRNILFADFRRAGVGVAIKDGSVYATEVFLGPPHAGNGT